MSTFAAPQDSIENRLSDSLPDKAHRCVHANGFTRLLSAFFCISRGGRRWASQRVFTRRKPVHGAQGLGSGPSPSATWFRVWSAAVKAMSLWLSQRGVASNAEAQASAAQLTRVWPVRVLDGGVCSVKGEKRVARRRIRPHTCGAKWNWGLRWNYIVIAVKGDCGCGRHDAPTAISLRWVGYTLSSSPLLLWRVSYFW